MKPSFTPPTKDEVTTWLAEHGDVLYRYAMQRVGNRDFAEDLVQDTFVSALRAADSFQGRSKVQTWLVGILRNKIVDHMRKLARQRKLEANEAAELSTFQDGHWRVGVKTWASDPSSCIEMQEFWQVLAECQAKLPAKLAAAFRMRDMEELAMPDICETLDISSSNLCVRLHRARVLLRECLDQNWFSNRRQK